MRVWDFTGSGLVLAVGDDFRFPFFVVLESVGRVSLDRDLPVWNQKLLGCMWLKRDVAKKEALMREGQCSVGSCCGLALRSGRGPCSFRPIFVVDGRISSTST